MGRRWADTTMNRNELIQLIEELAPVRPVFHSEADFQHALALSLGNAGFDVRLEKPLDAKINGEPARCELDLLVSAERQSATAIELKYFRKAWSGTIDRESFRLVDTWGTNLSRFDCWADFQRVQAIVDAGYAEVGYAVALTNASDAWSVDTSLGDTFAKHFSINDGRRFESGQELRWHKNPTANSVSSKRLAHSPIVVPNDGVCEWRSYRRLPGKHGEFRFLIMETKSS